MILGLDLTGWLVLTGIWCAIWCVLYSAAREGNGKQEYANRPNGPFKDYRKDMRLMSWMILATPIWPVALCLWLGWIGLEFVGNVINSAQGRD